MANKEFVRDDNNEVIPVAKSIKTEERRIEK